MSNLTPEQQLLNVAAHALAITEATRTQNGKGRCATYVGNTDELASTARQLAEMVRAFLSGELAAAADEVAF